jgi:hypothetical protein
MALTGQLSDMSLAELIEFFCNQRKTGRLKIDYPRGHSVFFIREGELVDARVGSLSGVEAVYFSLTLPNAAFDFSPDVQATRRTINDSWTQVVLEGLRRLDEGHAPSEADAFGGWSPSDADLATMFNQVENLDAAESKKDAKAGGAVSSDEPFSMMVEGANGSGGSKKKWMVMGVAAGVVLACTVAAVPLMSRPSKPEAAATVSAQPAPAAPEANPVDAAASPEAAPAESPEAGSAEAAARREREERDRRERDRRERERKAEDAAANKEDAALAASAKPVAPVVASGPKSVRVTVAYDESGRVTQASVAGTSPGAEAYGGTAVRIARGRRFPAGKAGSTVVTIPVN